MIFILYFKNSAIFSSYVICGVLDCLRLFFRNFIELFFVLQVSEKMSTQLGPKSFPIDRLMAIFYAILDEKVPLTCNLMAQIPSLVHLKLLNFVSGESNIMEGSARLQCIVSHEFILQIGRNVGFNVREYLGDFI